MNFRGPVCVIRQNIQNSFSINKVPVQFSQRSAQTRPRSPECGGSFYRPPPVEPPRSFRFPSWARIPSSRPATSSILPTRMNHSIFRMGYIIPEDRGTYPDVYTGRLDLHELFIDGQTGARPIQIGIRYETNHRVLIELQVGGSFGGAFQILRRANQIVNPLICRIRSLPPGTQFTFSIPFPR